MQNNAFFTKNVKAFKKFGNFIKFLKLYFCYYIMGVERNALYKIMLIYFILLYQTKLY